MKAKDFVKHYFPRMKSEKQKTNSGEKYYLIREIGNTMYFSEGKTEALAWLAAMEEIINNDYLEIKNKQPVKCCDNFKPANTKHSDLYIDARSGMYVDIYLEYCKSCGDVFNAYE